MRDTKSASRRHEDETDRLREEMKALKTVIPKSMTANKEFTDNRLKEITGEVKSLKALINRRMTNAAPPSQSPSSASAPAPAPSSSTPGPLQMPTNNMSNGNNDYLRLHAPANPDIASAVSTPGIDLMAKELGESRRALQDETLSHNTRQDYLSALSNRSSPFSGMPATKAAIPSWQLAAAGGSEDAGGSGSGSKDTKEQNAGASGSS